MTALTRNLPLIAAAVVGCLTAAVLAQVLIGADGRVVPVDGRMTWAHVASPYLKGDGTTGYRHAFFRTDLVAGLGGPFPFDENGGSDSWRLAVYTTQDRYPTLYLPSLGLGDENLDWAVAVEAVVRENPGGIVELSEYLP